MRMGNELRWSKRSLMPKHSTGNLHNVFVRLHEGLVGARSIHLPDHPVGLEEPAREHRSDLHTVLCLGNPDPEGIDGAAIGVELDHDVLLVVVHKGLDEVRVRDPN